MTSKLPIKLSNLLHQPKIEGNRIEHNLQLPLLLEDRTP